MISSSNNCHNSRNTINPDQIVNIPISLFTSIEGRYFVGQTESMSVDDESVAWASLVNPRNSGVDLYANVFTVSNFSDETLTAQIWLNTELPDKRNISQNVSPTNTSIRPLPKNKVKIEFAELELMVPKKGINVYQRIVPPKTTLVGEEDGKFIEGPRGNYTLIIKSSSKNCSEVVVAFGWWEKPRH